MARGLLQACTPRTPNQVRIPSAPALPVRLPLPLHSLRPCVNSHLLYHAWLVMSHTQGVVCLLSLVRLICRKLHTDGCYPLIFTWQCVATVLLRVCGTCVAGEGAKLEVKGLFYGIGHQPNSQLVAGQIDLDDHGYVKVLPCVQHALLANR